MDWEIYTVFSVISGALLILMGLFGTRLSTKDRVTGALAGAACVIYGFYVAAQTSGTYYFPAAIFVIPLLIAGYLVYALVTHSDQTAPSSTPAHDATPDATPDAAVSAGVALSEEAAAYQLASDSGLQSRDDPPAPMHSTVDNDAPAPAPAPEPPTASQAVEVAHGARTDVGRVRQVNEDAVLNAPPVFLVADGVGGYEAGDFASATVVAEFANASELESVTPEWIRDRFERANKRIRAGAGGNTTASGAALIRQDDEPYWLIFNIGDSRVYQWADGELSQVTVDHSVVQELVDAGQLLAADARTHPQRHVITRAVGADEDFQPEFWMVPVRRGERLMICSDGLTSEIPDSVIGEIVARPVNPQRTCDDLVSAALQAGGHDNVSVVVVDVIAVGDRADDCPSESQTRPRSVAATGRPQPDADSDDTHPRPFAGSVNRGS